MGGYNDGFPLNTLDVPMMKGSNGIIAIDTDETKERPCINADACVDVCPMELSPLYFREICKEENWQGMKDMNTLWIVLSVDASISVLQRFRSLTVSKPEKNAVRGDEVIC